MTKKHSKPKAAAPRRELSPVKFKKPETKAAQPTINIVIEMKPSPIAEMFMAAFIGAIVGLIAVASAFG